MTMANSAGSTGLATCIRKPAARAFNRSSERPSAVRAMAGICSDCRTPRSASSAHPFERLVAVFAGHVDVEDQDGRALAFRQVGEDRQRLDAG